MNRGMNFMQIDSKVLIDSNVLVYAVELTSPNHNRAKAVLIEYCDAGACVVSAQNLAEFMFVVNRKNRATFESANQFVSNLAENAIVVTYTEKDVLRANQICYSYNVPFFDALLVATMEREKIFTIITENVKDFKKIDWLEVINPF